MSADTYWIYQNNNYAVNSSTNTGGSNIQFIDIGTKLWDRTNSKIEEINTNLGKNTETTKRIKKEEKERTKELDAQRKILNDIAKRDTQRVKKGVKVYDLISSGFSGAFNSRFNKLLSEIDKLKIEKNIFLTLKP